MHGLTNPKFKTTSFCINYIQAWRYFLTEHLYNIRLILSLTLHSWTSNRKQNGGNVFKHNTDSRICSCFPLMNNIFAKPVPHVDAGVNVGIRP